MAQEIKMSAAGLKAVALHQGHADGLSGGVHG